MWQCYQCGNLVAPERVERRDAQSATWLGVQTMPGLRVNLCSGCASAWDQARRANPGEVGDILGRYFRVLAYIALAYIALVLAATAAIAGVYLLLIRS